MRVTWLAVFLAIACTRESPPDTSGPRITNSSDNVPIAYEVHGTGDTTLVLVHGWSCDRTYWRRQTESLSRDYRVVALDLAGHGASGSGRAAWSIPNFAKDVVAVMEALDADRVVLVGHSLGGPVVLEAGRLAPDRVIGVVGVEAFFDEWSDPGHAKFADQLRPDFAVRTRAFVRQGLFRPTSPAALADSIADDMARAPPEIALPALDSMFAWVRNHQHSALQAVPAPIGLIMVADAKTGQFQRSRATRPTLGIETIPAAGHFLMLEAPDTFNARLKLMLSRIGTRQTT